MDSYVTNSSSCYNISWERIIMRMGWYFTESQFKLMDSAFELSRGLANPKEDYTDLIDRAITFGSRYNNLKARALAIFNNIIDHNGDFKP
jgi:hypothetical protein